MREDRFYYCDLRRPEMLKIEQLTVAYNSRMVLARGLLNVEMAKWWRWWGRTAPASPRDPAVSGVVPLQHGDVRINGGLLHGCRQWSAARYLAVVPRHAHAGPSPSTNRYSWPHRTWLVLPHGAARSRAGAIRPGSHANAALAERAWANSPVGSNNAQASARCPGAGHSGAAAG
jgi:hypothetical protein